MQKFTITEHTLKQLEAIHTDLNIVINEVEASRLSTETFTREQVLNIINMARGGEIIYDSHYNNADTQVEVEVETRVAGGYYETTYHTIDTEVDLKDLFTDNEDRFSNRWDYAEPEEVLEAWVDAQKTALDVEKERQAQEAAQADAEAQPRPLTEEEKAQLEANLEETRKRLEANHTAE